MIACSACTAHLWKFEESPLKCHYFIFCTSCKRERTRRKARAKGFAVLSIKKQCVLAEIECTALGCVCVCAFSEGVCRGLMEVIGAIVCAVT